MTMTGGCHCGAIRYEVAGTPVHVALCHCTDCRRASGAPMVGWALFGRDEVRVTGTPADYASSPGTTRQFCGTCGTGLFFLNEAVFPGQIDIQSATLDAPEVLEPTARIQMADAPAWASRTHALPAFERYPG